MSARKQLRVGDRVTTISQAIGGVFTVTRVCTCTPNCRIVQVKNADGDGWFTRGDLRRLPEKKRTATAQVVAPIVLAPPPPPAPAEVAVVPAPAPARRPLMGVRPAGSPRRPEPVALPAPVPPMRVTRPMDLADPFSDAARMAALNAAVKSDRPESEWEIESHRAAMTLQRETRQ